MLSPEELGAVLRGERPVGDRDERVPLHAIIWAWLLALVSGKAPKLPEERTLSRVAYRRRGFRVDVVDTQTKDHHAVRAGSVPEAKQLVLALTVGALHAPEAPALEVLAAAMVAVDPKSGPDAQRLRAIARDL